MDELIRTAGSMFSPEQYLFWTRIQCCAWTVADVVIILCLLRLGDVSRRLCGRQGHVFSYIALAATILPALAVPFASTGMQIFVVELLVTIPHFLIIINALTLDARSHVLALKMLCT
jgi:hypothetical protein